MLCVIVCLLISGVNLFNIFNLEIDSFKIGALNINVMGILTLILAINYGILLKTLNKKWFYLLLGINAIILIYNLLSLQIFIIFIVAIILTFLLTYSGNIRSNERNANIPQIEVITDYINIRNDRDVNSDIIGEVYYGEIYDIISEDEESYYNWYEIETSNGIRGFIVGKR